MQLPKANAVKSWIQNMDQFGPDPWFLRKLPHQFATPITHPKKKQWHRDVSFRISSLQFCQSIWHRLHPGEHRLAAPYSGMPPTGKNARPTAQGTCFWVALFKNAEKKGSQAKKTSSQSDVSIWCCHHLWHSVSIIYILHIVCIIYIMYIYIYILYVHTIIALWTICSYHMYIFLYVLYIHHIFLRII